MSGAFDKRLRSGSKWGHFQRLCWARRGKEECMQQRQFVHLSTNHLIFSPSRGLGGELRSLERLSPTLADSPCHSVFGWLKVRNIKTDFLRNWKWGNMFLNLNLLTILLIVQDIEVTSVIKLLLGGRLITTLGAPQRCYSCDWNGLGGCKKAI